MERLDLLLDERLKTSIFETLPRVKIELSWRDKVSDYVWYNCLYLNSTSLSLIERPDLRPDERVEVHRYIGDTSKG